MNDCSWTRISPLSPCSIRERNDTRCADRPGGAARCSLNVDIVVVEGRDETVAIYDAQLLMTGLGAVGGGR